MIRTSGASDPTSFEWYDLDRRSFGIMAPVTVRRPNLRGDLAEPPSAGPQETLAMNNR